MEEFDNAIPPLGVEPGLPSNFEGSDAFQASIAPTNEPLISVTDTYAVPGVPVPSAFGSVAVDYDPSNPFDVAKQAMAKPITESDIAFQNSKEKYFQPGYQQTNFDRYYNDSDNFYKLGFNPVSNNEALYNQNRSWYQDLFRAAGGIPALGLSVVQSGYRSLADMATGDFSMTDETGAREFSQIMAERGSTRGGAAGFVSNLALQSGFVAGIAADYLATEALLTGAVALSDGMALPAALAASAAKTAGTIKSISALFDANAARQAYNTIKAMDVAAIGRGALNVAEATAKNIVPNTFKNVKSFITAESPVLGLANSVRGVADFVRDMKQISYATAEASMEGGGVKNDFIDKHINEYITENGVYPDQDRLNRIYEKASDAGFTTGLINAPLILLTNNITFDNLYKGRKRTLGKTASGIVEESKLSGRTLRFSEKTGQFETMGIRQSFAESVRGLKTPKTYLNFASSYFSKNLSEGLQEISQEIISGASTDYYERLYDTPEAGGVVAYLADAYDNLKDQASAQGIEVFASGFLMGGLTGISTAVANRAYGSTKNIIGKIAQAKNPEEYRKAYAEESARFDKIAVELNDAINNGNKILAVDIDNLLVQIKAGTDMVNARKSFDEKAFHDLKDIARFNSIYTALRAGKYDYFLRNLEDMKQMTGAELKEAFDLKDDVTDEEAKQVLDITIDRAGQIKDQYEQFSAFKNPYDINKYKFANTPEAIIAFVNESQSHEAFEEARKTAVFSLHGLEQAKTRMANLTKEMSSIAGVADLGYSDVTATLSIPGIDKEINLLTAEIDASKDITDPGLIEITNNKKKKLKALESLKTNLARIENINDPVEVRKTSYLKKAFTDYMKVLLDEKGTTLNPANIGEAYRIFTDYYALNYDKTNFNKVLSDLYDPNNFIKLAQRERTLIVARDKRRAEFFKKAFNKYAESSKIGVFLKALAETGFVIDLKYLKALDTNTFDELKELILNDPDVKFRDLNSNKLFGSDDPRYADVKKFISEFVIQVAPPVAETVVTESDSLTAEPKETTYVTIDELENLDPYFNFVLTRFYEKENKDRKNNKQAPLTYIEYSLYPAAQNVINAFKELQVLYDVQKKEGDTVDKWLTNSQANSDVYNIISKYGIPVAELANLLANPDVFVMNTLPPNFKLETPTAINGLFIISGETTNKDDEVEYTYLLVDNRSNLVDVTGAYKTLPIALEARERLAKTYIKESEGFQFGNKYFYNGQTVSDSKGNTYTVVSNADSIKQAIKDGRPVVLELKNEEGRIVPKRSVQDIFPGPYQKKNPDVAYIKDVNRYNSIYPHKTQEEFGSPEGEKAAEARLKEFLLNTPIDDIKNNLTIKLTKNKVTNTRGSYLRIGDKINGNILERKEKISIQILYKGQPIGYLRTIQQLQILDGNAKSIDVFKDLTPDLFSRFFESTHPGEFSNDFIKFKSALGTSVRLQKKFTELLGDNQSIELSNEEVKSIIYPSIGLGSYANNDPGVTTELSELKYTTLEGGHYIIDRTFSYKAGTFISSTNIITDLKGEARKRADERVKKGLEISKTDGLNRYLLAVELPNGNIRFVSLVSPELSADQSQTLIADINNLAKVARTDNTKNDITFTQGSNKELIFDKVFNAHQPGIYSRFYIDSTGYLIGEFSDNNSFNQSSSTQPFLRYDLAANPLESIDAMIELFNDSIKNGSSLKDNKYKRVKFSKQTFKVSLPESISIREALAVFKSTVGPEIVKDISFGLNLVKSVADTNLGRSVRPTSMAEFEALAKSKKETTAKTETETEEDVLKETFVKLDEEEEEEEDTTKDTKSSIFDQYKAMKDGEAAFLQKGRNKIVEDSKETDNPIGNAKASRLFEESEEAKAYYAELDRLEKLLDNEDDSTFVALKIIEGSKYQEEDLNKLDEFRDWVSKNLPDIFTVEELKTLQENLVAGNVTVGSFVTYLDGIAGGIADVRGRINVGTRTPFKYHEAFHAVFRLLLSEKQIQRYLGTAKKEVLAQINSGKITWDNSAVKGVKNLDQALENLRLSNPLYSMMSKKQLEETLYEEYLADMFEAWKKNVKVPTDYTHKTIFAKIKDLIIAFFKRAFQRNNYQNLFKDIDLGKYANAVTQENRFTRSFEGGNPNIEALKTIKIDTERIKIKSGNTERYVKINKYLAGDRATRLIASVASSLHYLRQDPANSEVSDNDLYDRIFDDYINFYNSDAEYYRDLDNYYDIKNDLNDIVKAFTGKENQEQLKEAAKDYLRVLSYQDSATEDDISNQEDNGGPISTTDARKESYTIGGFGSLSSYVRTYIATTSFQSNSEFGRPIEDGSLVYSVVDSAKVYNGLLSALSGITSEREGLRKLNFLRTNPNTDTAKFINKMFEDHNITFDPTGEPILNEIVNPGQLLAILKAFEKFKINYKFIGFDPVSGIVRIINANSRDDSKAQMVYWENQYQKKYDYNAESVKSQGPEVLSTLIDVIKGEDKETDVNELAIQIEDTIGIDIQPLYIRLSIAHNIPEELRTADDLAIINGFPDVEPIDIEDLVQISKVISAGINPFYRKAIVEEDEDTTDEVEETKVVDQTFEGARQRLKNIAKANVIFDETMGATSWINADGERVWGHQSPTYNHKKTRALRDLADSTKLGEALEDIFAANNYMLSTDAFQSILPGISLDRVDGMRLEALYIKKGQTGNSNRIVDRGSDGTTAGQLSDVQYLVTNLALYLSGEKITYRNKSNNIISTGVTATINPGVIESSSTIDLVNLPVIKAVTTENKKQVITNDVINAIKSMVKGEYERIKQVQKEINNPEIIKKDGYHTSYNRNAPRGLQFIRTASILGTSLKEQLEASAKEDIDFNEAIKDVNLEKQVNAFYNEYLDKFIDVMVKQNMIKIDEKTNKISYKTTSEGGIGGVPKFLADGMMINKEEINEEMNSLKNLISVREKDGPDYDTAFRHNLMQIFINHHINSTFFNYLINGDPARFIQAKSLSPAKIAIEEFKRLKGVNANGQSAYTELIAPDLGINQATTELDIATFIDPTYVGKFANDTVEEANAQMYITLKTLRHLLFGFGKLSKRQAAFLDKIEKGEELFPEEVFGKNGSIAFNGQTNSLKIVYYNNGDNKAGYIKTSAFVLTKQLTTGSDGEALPGKEMLHNLRLSLEKQEVNGRLASAVPVSGSKGERKNIAASSQDISSDNFSVLDMRYLTLQQENPSNKMEITDPSQIKQLIGVELPADQKIIFNGKEWPAKDLVTLYEMAVAQRVTIKYNSKANKVFGLEDVESEINKSKKAKKTTVNLADFAKYAQNILKATGATNQEIEFFALDENGNLKYDINNPIVEKKFIQLYFTYFTKGVMQEKVPGQSLTLVSSHGYNVVKVYTGQVDELGIPIGEVVRESDIKANPSKYKNLKTFSEETGVDGYKAGDLYIDKLRHNVPVYDKNGKVTERYSEVVMPAHDKNVYKYLKSGKIPDFIAKGFGIRIPSQDKHSAIGVRIVDFLPVFYGSVVIAPNELIEISGADFDVDKLYNSIKEFFYDKKNKQFVEYGSGKTDKQKFDQYVQYLSREDEDYKVAYAALKEGAKEEDKPITQDDLAKLKKRYEEGITEEEEIEEDVNLVEKALKSLNYPSTPKEYAKLYKANGNRDIYVGALNNLILDAKYALTFNDYTSKPADEFATGAVKGVKNAPRAFQVAHVEPLTDVLDDIKDDIKKLLLKILKKDGEETLSEELQMEFDTLFNKAISTFEEDGYDSTTLLGMYYGWKNNKEGAANIGASVKGNLSWGFLQKLGFQTQRSIFNINGKDYNNYGAELTEDGVRKAYVISALITAMTDNAKERLAARLGLNITALNYVTHMVAVGVPLKTSIIFINQPSIKKYFDLVKGQEGEFKRRVEYVSPEDLMAKAVGLESWEKFLMVFSELQFPKLNEEELLSQFYAETDLVQYAVINQLYSLSKTTPYFNDVASMTGLVKGFAPFMDTFDDVADKFDTLTNTNENNIFVSYDEKGMTVNEFVPLLDKAPLTKSLLNIYFDIRGKLKYVFKRRTAPFMLLSKAVMNNVKLNMSGSFRRTFKNELDEDILSYLDIMAYKQYLTEKGNLDYLSSLNNSLIYKQEGIDSIVQKVQAVRKANFEKGLSNLFLDKFIFTINSEDTQNKDGLEYLESNSWSKLSPTMATRLESSFTELYNEDPKLAVELFHYLLVKDGGRYRSGSFLNVMPLFIMDDFFAATKKSMDILSDANSVDVLRSEGFRSTFGYNFDQIIDSFVFNYFRSANLVAKGQGISYIFNKFNPFLKGEDGKNSDKTNRTVKINPETGAITINVFGGVRETRPKEKLEERRFIDIDGNNYSVFIATDAEETSSGPLSDEERERLVENNKFLSKFGFIYDKKLYTGAPPYLYFGGKLYKLSEVIGSTRKDKDIKSLLSFDADIVKAYGSKFKYVPVTVRGSIKATRVGFAFDGQLPDAKEKESRKKSKGENSSGTLDDNKKEKFSGSMADLLNLAAKGKKVVEEQPKSTNNPLQQLSELGITKKPKEFVYVDETTGSTLTQYTGMVPQEVLDLVSRNTDEETENPFVEDVATYTGEITSLKENEIFVFGSNEGSSTGRKPTHGLGNAKVARDKFGAIQGQPRGLQGQSYGIVTKKFWDKERSSSPEEIKREIERLYQFATNNPDKILKVAYMGGPEVVGNSGYTNAELASMFAAFSIPSNVQFEVEFAKGINFTSSSPVVSKSVSNKPVINIYWGSAESSTNTRVLSNLAPRKFTYDGKEYGSVEHAYQTLKSGSFDQVTYDKYVTAGGYGTKIRGKAVTAGFDNLQLMRDLVVESFKQNPEQAKLLLNYSDFTHTTNEVIDKAFLEGIRLAQKNVMPSGMQTQTAVSSTPVAKKPAVSKEDSELQVIYDTQLTEAYRNKTSFDIFKNNFLLLKRMGIPVEDIIKNMCK